MRKSARTYLAIFSLIGLVSIASACGEQYRSRDFAFQYPAHLKLSSDNHGSVLRLAEVSHSPYWRDTITIQKQNKKTEECDPPNDTRPDDHDRRTIAGRRAFAYFGEDAAMNRATRTKGYIMETRDVCWRFELVRRSRPFHKFDLPKNELKRLNQQSDQDWKMANVAFRMVLDSFVLTSRAR